MRELGDDLAALYELIGGAYRLVTALSPSGPAEAPAILPKELLLSPFKDVDEAEPRRFLGEISASSVRLTALAMPELILAGSPGKASARTGDGRAAAAAAFRRERLAEERPVELIGRSLFAELRAEHASMAAPYAAVYALDLDPVVAEWSEACPLVDEAAFYRDALRFMAKALAETGCVRAAPGYGVVAAQFCPRMPDAELLAKQLASTMRRILALEDGPAPLGFVAVDLRERESAEAIKAFLPDGF